MSKKLRKCLSLVLAVMLLASISLFGTLNASADYKTGDGLAAYAMTAYNEGWRYVWGGASYGAVDCSGLIYSYVGGGARVTEDMLYSSPESGYVANGVPDIPGLGLWQPGHVGVYIGNGMAVDARDEISNVCYSAVSSKSWVMWFKVAGVTYGGETSAANDNQNTEKTDSAANTDTSAESVVPDVLSIGSQGKEVNALQERLKELGYFSDSTTEYFGTVTQSALIEFQTAAGFTADGILTDDVKAALFADNAPEKTISSNVNPEETADSETEETDTDTETVSDTDSYTDMYTTVDEAYSPADTAAESYIAVDLSDGDDSDAAYTENDTERENVSSDVIYKIGDIDEEITNIQYILILLGYYDYDLTTTYDDNTAYAVAQYQLDNDLSATGDVDQRTYNSLYGIFGGNDSERRTDTQTDSENEVMTVGDEGERVEDLQQSLTLWGFIDEDNYENGVYDESTREAVEFAQGIFGFTVDGNADEELVTALTVEDDNEDTDKSVYVQRSQTSNSGENTDAAEQPAEAVSESDASDSEVKTEKVNVQVQSDTDSAALAAGTVSTDTDSSADTKADTKSTDTAKTTAVTTSSASGDTKPADVPKTGVITLYPKTVAAIGIIISLMIIFFAANVHYWNVSMEKRRQRERRASSVSAYRRSS